MDDEAQVGIGTMIIFIATVLVAAVAAGVLLDISGKLQERSSRTGAEATEQVATNLQVESVIGTRVTTSNASLQYFNITVALAPGASDFDMSQLKVQILLVDSVTTLSYSSSGVSATEFAASSIRDADSSWSAGTPAMTAGDLIEVHVQLDMAGLVVDNRDGVKVSFLPEVGTGVEIGFTTPPTFGSRTIVQLY